MVSSGELSGFPGFKKGSSETSGTESHIPIPMLGPGYIAGLDYHLKFSTIELQVPVHVVYRFVTVDRKDEVLQ
ncbi:hypothetical protein GCM10007392_16480 [Saccharospirillum salsuginis]|uniref:Uncharacterized protein n=1 Tax=Saccharospirillum salsuginis TaxID=418750 RepID=A0A918K6N0_9GAMM|nr:hypothetical protein GCM10007392_16480 [Saccharospirillum salsuginis]